MTTQNPPIFITSIFNSSFFNNDSSGLSESTANLLYLRKKVVDIATSLEIFSGGLKTNSIDSYGTGSTLDICSTQISGDLNIASASGRFGNINIGTGLTTGYCDIVLGSSSVTNYQGIKINRPLRLNYDPLLLNNFEQLGYSELFESTLIQISSGTPSTPLQVDLFPGIYLMNYELYYELSGAGTSGVISSYEYGIGTLTPPVNRITEYGLGQKYNHGENVTLPSNSFFSNSGSYKVYASPLRLYFVVRMNFDKTIFVRARMNITRIG